MRHHRPPKEVRHRAAMSFQRWRFTDALNFSVAFVIRVTFNAAGVGIVNENGKINESN
jgi:hypothetical protein